MGSIDELILKTTKERIGPAGFHETFKTIYTTVEEIAKGSQHPPEQDTEETDS